MDTQIAQVKIHPAIGIARVGNSDKQPFIGPESPDQPALPPGSYKDSSGKVIRQAARFRIYGYNRAGEVVRELKLGEGDVTEIKWSVHLANKKSAWYQFHLPLDIKEAHSLPPAQLQRRNFDIKGAERKKLVIDAGDKMIRASLHETAALSGKIMNRQVPLGSIATQTDGRLLVVGGVGKSASYATPRSRSPASPTTTPGTTTSPTDRSRRRSPSGASRRPRAPPGPWSPRRTTRPA